MEVWKGWWESAAWSNGGQGMLGNECPVESDMEMTDVGHGVSMGLTHDKAE